MMIILKGFALLVGFALLAYFGSQAIQQRLLYFPDTRRTTPAEADLPDVEEREVVMQDGARVLTWWGAAQPDRPTLLYYHGNGGSFVTRAERIRKYMTHGYGVVMMTYRGFGGSAGTPSETANVADALSVYEAVRASGVPPADIVVYGESLGTGVAVQVAAQRQIGGLILDAPYTSIVDLAALHYPYLPARWLMTDRYEILPYASRVTAPVLIVHGEADDVIPVEMSKRVAAAFRGRAKVVTFPGAGHSDHYLYGSYETIYAWLASLYPMKPIVTLHPSIQ
jgi:fermentation-respiration switch protein FrsA (DUF1100 family)